METNVEQCPWCGFELSSVKLLEIRAKIREEEQRKSAEFAQAEAVMRQRLDQQFKLALEKQTQATEKKANEYPGQQVKKVAAELDQVAKKLKDAQEREADLLKKARQEAEKQWQKELADQRQAFEKDKALTLLKQQSDFNRERESLQKKMQKRIKH